MCPYNKRVHQAGFSMVEVLVATSVMMIVLASVFGLMGRSITGSNETYELTESQESLRTAQEYIQRDLTTVGDGLKSIGGIQVPARYITTYVSLAPGIDPINFPIIASDDNVPGTTVVPLAAQATTILGGTDRITLLSIDPNFASIPLPAGTISAAGNTITVSAADQARVSIGEIYCVTSRLGAAFGTITAINPGATPSLSFSPGGADASFGFNQLNGPIMAISRDPQTGLALATTLARIRIIQYFVNNNRLLIRRVFGVRGGAFIDSVVAEHVTDLKIRYSLNLPDPNGFARQPVSQLTSSTEQSAVREVEVSITTETAHPINYGAPWPVTMTTSTSVRNLQFRRALQPTRAG